MMRHWHNWHRRSTHGPALSGPCAIVLLLFAFTVGCDSDSEAPTAATSEQAAPSLSTEERKAQALEAVQSFYDAAARGDCERVMELVPKFSSEEECEHFSERFAGHGLRYRGAKNVHVDGRDPNAVIVEAQTMRRGEPDSMILRAEYKNDGWIIVF